MRDSRTVLGIDQHIRSLVVVSISILAAVLALASAPTHAAPTVPIGATAGSFSVDANGGANYTIPIQVPPGTAGMAPSVSLSYSAQVDSGILPKGWSVSGLSIITRCGRSIPLDGQKGGVNYDDNDRYCLNGQRLVAINNGTDGANNTEYRTERETFSKIISYRDSAFPGKGPQSFKVWTASGSIMEYGTTDDARIEAQGRTDSSVRLWALNKVQDRAGNYFTVSYYEDTANGEYRPTRIDYTGNSATSLTPYNSVRFVYEAQNRPDIVPRYEAGSKIQSTRRLTSLETYTDTTKVREYKLTHDNNGAAGASRLVSVQECGSDGVCLPGTTFGWQQDTIYFASPAVWLQHGPHEAVHDKYGDINGDGKTDVVHVSSDGSYYVSLSTGTGFTAPQVWLQHGAHDPSLDTLVDVNGDGLSDVIHLSSGSGSFYVSLSTGSGFTTPQVWLQHGPHEAVHDKYADVNGDGRSDVIHVSSNGGYYVSLSTGAGFTIPQVWLQHGAHDPSLDTFVDVNGDGLADVIHLSSGTGSFYVSLSTGSGFTTPQVWLQHGPHEAVHDRYGDINGDGRIDVVHVSDNGSFYVSPATPGNAPDLLVSVINGVGAVTTITHKPLTDFTTHTKDSGAVYPYQDVQSPMYVVSRYTVSDGLGGEAGVSYKYAGAKTHLQGGGWLGFRSIETTDERTGNKTVAEYNQNFESGVHGTTSRTESYVNGVLTSRTQNFYSARSYLTGSYVGKQKFVQLDGTLAETFELNGAGVNCAQVDSTYDDFGSVLSVVSKVDATCSFASAVVKTTTATYDHDTTNWQLGRITRSQTVNEAPGTPSITRTAAYAYNSSGFLASDTVEPDSTTLRVTNSYTYDAFGNQTRIEVSGPNFPTRATTGTRDSRGRFALTTTNALGHTETRVFDPKWGVVTSQTGPNGLTSTMDYDGLGRLVSTTSPDNKTVTTNLALCDGSDADCPTLAKTRVTTTAVSNGVTLPPSTAYLDLLGRTLRTKGRASNGQDLFQDTEYNNLGQLVRRSASYYRGSSPTQWTSYAYDAAGRGTTVTAPDGSLTATTYGVTAGIGPKTCVTNAKGQQNCIQNNAVGQAIESIDALNGRTRLTFDAVGNVTQVMDAANNTVLTAVYDTKGRKTNMVDADSGARTYSYNALGELVSETDAKGQTASVTYDLLGRIRTRTGLEGTYTWTYDTAALGSTGRLALGRLTTVTGPNYARTPAYDNYGRELSVTTTINGTGYSVSTAYDAHGRPETATYPTGFKTKNVYDATNRVVEVRNGTTNALYWQVNPTSYNEFGQLLNFSLGNGLTTELTYDPVTHALKTVRTGSGGVVQNLEYGFDAIGNLTSRTDHTQGYTETFGYDVLNRLTQVSGPSSKTYAYDAIGNITSKSDVGSYSYHATKVHAVVSTTGTLNNTYTYDANGNLINGAGRTLQYTSFNKPSQITANGITTTFTYGPTFERLTKTNAQSETVYLGKLYERVTQGTAVTHRHYVVSPAGLVAVVSQGATDNVRYLHGDHLGSTSAITDESGNVVERLSFDPHGKRRQTNGLDATGPITSQTNRGYTGHEMDDESGLVNMNAREYDPVLGRFMQPDVVADSFGSQGLNRYSYVSNNPLNAMDPSGNKSKFLERLTPEKVLKYGPLAHLGMAFLFNPVTVNPVSTSPQAMHTKIGEQYGRQEIIEPWLLENPKYIPIAKAVVTTVICIFTCEYDFGATTALMAGILDARFTSLMGGDNTDQWHAFNRAYISTGITSAAGAWVGGTVWTEGFDSFVAGTIVKSVAGGIASEVQGGSFASGFWSGMVAGIGAPLMHYGINEISGPTFLSVNFGGVQYHLDINWYVSSFVAGGLGSLARGESFISGGIWNMGSAVARDVALGLRMYSDYKQVGAAYRAQNWLEPSNSEISATLAVLYISPNMDSVILAGGVNVFGPYPFLRQGVGIGSVITVDRSAYSPYNSRSW